VLAHQSGVRPLALQVATLDLTVGRRYGRLLVTRAGVHDRTATADEVALLRRLRAGDERAFESLVDRTYGTMLAVAQTHVRSRAVAEEVVQEAWLGVLNGLGRFEGRSSLKTWILRITVNIARTKGAREARTVPYASLAPEGEEPAVDPDRFRARAESFAGHWTAYPADWHELPEDALLEHETLRVVVQAIDRLPDAQRAVITMRDVQGCGSEEVCEALEVSEGNQRVLLHRARSRVRAELERHFDD
jgi:RNA polymerase sigma-70 factor (ECF subfamily)